MKRRYRCFWSVLLSACLLPQFSWAWGEVGHKTVAKIAEKHLTSEARAGVQELLGGRSLYEVAMWPDSARRSRGWEHTAKYHYVSIPDGEDYLAVLKKDLAGMQNRGDVLRAIVAAEDVLRLNTASRDEKKDALSFLVHFVGDIHQPLHVGRPDDHGGNSVDIDWYGQRMNLHAVWDSRMIEKSYEDVFRGRSGSEKSSLYAEHLDRQDAGTIERWLRGYTLEWLRESMDDRPAVYAVDLPLETYRQRGIRVIDRRIAQAGYRLAALLNGVYGGENHEGYRPLRAELARILGPDLRVNLKPKGKRR